MSNPVFIRALAEDEWPALGAGLRSKDAFVLRRCQILLASAKGQKPAQIAASLACASQTVRNAVHAFNQQGLSCLTEGSSRPKSVEPVLTEHKRQHLQALLHQSLASKPAHVRQEQESLDARLGTLGLLAEVACEQDLSDTILSAPTLLDAVRRLEANWKRAKHWISSSDPAYARKKAAGSADMSAC